MIPVTPADEPDGFDADVRQPGLRAIAELVGEKPPRRGGRRFKKVADSREEIPADAYPAYWRESIDDLLLSYQRLCAYLCLYIPRGTGAPSVDHMVAKSTRWDRVYEWDNYRLACSLMNSRKGAVPDVLDPFEVRDGWFALELTGFQVVPGPGVEGDDTLTGKVESTIEELGLRDQECCDARAEYAEDYWAAHVDIDYLERHAPFVAAELRRQGRLLEGDA